MEEDELLYSQKELPVKKTLLSFLKISPRLKFIKFLNRVYQDYDEPKFYQFLAHLQILAHQPNGPVNSGGKAAGFSFFSEELALLKCLGEAVERYACMVYKASNLIKGSYKELKNHALNPNEIVSFSEKQKNKKSFARFNFYDDIVFTWIRFFTYPKFLA